MDTTGTTADPADTTPPSGDERAIFAECRACHAEGREISDACARAIVALWQDGQRSRAHAFASTGAILSDADLAMDTPGDIRDHDSNAPTLLWREIFLATTNENGARCTQYQALDPDWRLAADMFGTYLTHRTARGPQPGWSGLWPRP
jgi:hypothetical protein